MVTCRSWAGSVVSKPWSFAQSMIAPAFSTRRETYSVRDAASFSAWLDDPLPPSSSCSPSGTSEPNSSSADSKPGITLFSTNRVSAALLSASSGKSLVSAMVLIVSAVIFPMSARSFAVVCQRLFQT